MCMGYRESAISAVDLPRKISTKVSQAFAASI